MRAIYARRRNLRLALLLVSGSLLILWAMFFGWGIVAEMVLNKIAASYFI